MSRFQRLALGRSPDSPCAAGSGPAKSLLPPSPARLLAGLRIRNTMEFNETTPAIDEVAQSSAPEIGGRGAAGMDDSRHAGSGFQGTERPKHFWHVDWTWLVLVACSTCWVRLPNALFWSQVIAATDHPVGTSMRLRAFYVSAIGKYVPGKAMVLILRATLLRGSGVPATLITVGVFYETLNNMAVGSLVALLILLPDFANHRLLVSRGPGHGGGDGAADSAAGVQVWPCAYSGLKKLNPTAVEKLQSDQQPGAGDRLGDPGGRLVGAGAQLVGHAARDGAADGADLSLWPTLYGGDRRCRWWPDFLVLLPAGVGAREFVTIELLTPVCGDIMAVVSAILLRLVSVVADVGISSILYFVRPAAASRSLAGAGSAAEPAGADTGGQARRVRRRPYDSAAERFCCRLTAPATACSPPSSRSITKPRASSRCIASWPPWRPSTVTSST